MLLSEIYAQEEINLYNPAFCAALLFESMREYESISSVGMHCSLPYLVIPMSTNPQVSVFLPSTISTPIAGWVANNEGVLVGFASYVNAFIEIVDSAISFLLEKRAIEYNENGHFEIVEDKIAKNPAHITNNEELKRAYKTAGMLGRWFATASSVESVFAQLGVRP
jgi:hypothetical protein